MEAYYEQSTLCFLDEEMWSTANWSQEIWLVEGAIRDAHIDGPLETDSPPEGVECNRQTPGSHSAK